MFLIWMPCHSSSIYCLPNGYCYEVFSWWESIFLMSPFLKITFVACICCTPSLQLCSTCIMSRNRVLCLRRVRTLDTWPSSDLIPYWRPRKGLVLKSPSSRAGKQEICLLQKGGYWRENLFSSKPVLTEETKDVDWTRMMTDWMLFQH